MQNNLIQHGIQLTVNEDRTRMVCAEQEPKKRSINQSIVKRSFRASILVNHAEQNDKGEQGVWCTGSITNPVSLHGKRLLTLSESP